MLPDARFAADLHTHCPICSVSAPWVGDVVTALRWTRAGRPLAEVIPAPSAAVTDAVLLLEQEAAALDAATMELERARMDAPKGRTYG